MLISGPHCIQIVAEFDKASFYMKRCSLLVTSLLDLTLILPRDA